MYPLDETVYRQLLTTGVLDVPGAPFYPLESAGMPLPGPHFAAHAEQLGDVSTYDGVGRSRRLVKPGPLLSLLHFQALYSDDFALPIPVGNKNVSCKFLRGHRYNWTPGEIHPCPVMVIGKHPGAEEEEQGLNFQGPTSELFWRTCGQLGIDETARESWYLTNLVRFRPPDQNASKMSTTLIEDCAPLLHQELRLVRPKYILCLGADTCRELTGLTLKAMRGRVEQFTYQIGENEFGTAQVMAVLHPAQVYNKPEMAGELNSGLALFWRLLCGDDIGGDETDVDHRVVDNEAELAQIVDEILADPNPSSLVRALDAEWHGRNPWDPGSYLRTIQFSHKAKFAVCVKLTHPGGQPAFTPSPEAAYRQISRLVTQPGARIGGHFLRSDTPWFLLKAGIDLRPYYKPGPAPADVFKPGSGWETNLMEHAVNETGPFGLEALRSKYTTAPPYEVKLERWKKAYCLKNGLEEDELEGFGDWDEPEFYSYACLQKGSLVQLSDGSWRAIDVLVKEKYGGQVKAYGPCGDVIDASVVGWHRNDVGQKNWVRLRTATTPQGRHGLMGPVFTPDHKILTQRGKCRIDRLQPGDRIRTDELEFSSDQLSVFLACLLGDGGLQHQNGKSVGFGFGQRNAVAEYADWKAACFSTHKPKLRVRSRQRRYETPYGKYFRYLADRFPTKPEAEHGHRKLRITKEVLANLGDIGLAVWYQDDGTLVGCERQSPSARIAAVIDAEEQVLVLDWLSARLGPGVTYNTPGRFIQFVGAAFQGLQNLVERYGHPAMSYKMLKPSRKPYEIRHGADYFCEEVLEVVALDQAAQVRRGLGVRYCLTVEGAGNFLTKAGFVSNCYDADVTWRICDTLSKIVEKDSNGHDCREPYWRNHRASLAVLEMEMEGVVPDPVRIAELATKFTFVRNQLIADLRVQLNWPTFNPASDSQCRAMLFGDKFAKKMAPPGYPSFRLLDGETPAEGAKRILAMRPTPFDAERQELEAQLMPYMPDDVGKPHKDYVPKEMKKVFQQWKAANTKINKYHKENPPNGSFAEQQWIYLLPEGAVSQNLKPVLTTGKRKKLWSRIEADGLEDSFSPSTDKTVLGILSERSLVASQLRDTRFLGQMLTTTLRRPDIDKNTGDYQVDEDGEFVYEKGLLSYLSSDGRVHGRQRQDKETGRGSMSKPNLQAVSSRREDNYRLIMGYLEESSEGPVHRGSYIRLFPEPLYTVSVKSIFIPPAGHVFMESDYTGAEIAGIMWLSQDPQGMDDVRRNLLPENHPEYQDIHSMMAVRAFKLQCEPTKKALKKLNKSSLRTAAKGVVFGTPYGISAQAIAMACLAEGTPCTEAEAQAIIDYYFERYPAVKEQLDECVKRVYEPGHLCGVFGRRRRFPWTDDEKVRSDQERQAKNFRIQNLVADSVWTALGNMYEYRERRGNPNLFKFSLQIHDAIRLAVPYEHVPEVYRTVFPECMFNGVDIWPCDFDGHRLPLLEPYHLQGSREIGYRAGESIDDVCEAKMGADHPKITQLLEDPKNDGTVIDLLHKLAVA